MLPKIMKWAIFIGLTVCVFTSVFGCSNSTWYSEKDPSEQSPIRTLSIRLDNNQQEQLFSQIRKFSEKNQFSFSLSFYTDKEIFLIEMHGQGIKILALSKPVTITELDINFFEEDHANSSIQELVDELYNDLKTFISEIPGVVVVDE